MKKLLLALLLFPAASFAIELPSGCYVADYYRTDPCWGEGYAYFNWTYFTPRTNGVAYYGAAVEAIINQVDENETLILVARDLYNQLDAQCKASNAQHVNDFNQLVADYNGLVGAVKKRDSLIKKLRKACGNSCKKIK